jgi:hypothetical protein
MLVAIGAQAVFNVFELIDLLIIFERGIIIKKAEFL